MHEALLYEKLPGDIVRCHVCQWRCKINPRHSGVCRRYVNVDGVLYSMNYAHASSVAVDPIEKKPLFHFYPGTDVFSLGSWGCNFHCLDCQNWEISCASPTIHHESHEIEPQEAVRLAQTYQCQGIAWTYNEPTIWFEYTLDSARLAKEAGLYTVYVTNGFMTPEALDTIGPYLDAWRVDIKGFSDTLYHRLARVSNWRGILEVASRALHKWSMHVEVVTNVIPTLNDSPSELRTIAGWIKEELGEMTPWHVTRFYPQYKMAHLPPTPVGSLEMAYNIGKEAGLKFVYTGNVPGHEMENTYCYSCGKLVVKREGYTTTILGLNGSKCRYCGAELYFRVS